MYTLMSKQRGGTILGLIIGLIIGLGIAVVVALAITKTALPFTNKMGKAEKTAAQNASQASDPNKPLYGNKEPIKEAAKSFVKDPDAKPADAPETKAAETKAAADKAKLTEDSREAKAVARDAAIEAKAQAAAKAEEADAKPTIYYLQAGAFRDQNDAEGIRAKLALMGFEARITERPSENGTLYRVRIGPINQLEAMTKARTKLAENGVDASIIRATK